MDIHIYNKLKMLYLLLSILLIVINSNAYITKFRSISTRSSINHKTSIVPNRYNKKINLNYKRLIDFDFDFDTIKETKYAIIGYNNKRTQMLINEMEKNGIVVFLVDRIFFKDTEIIEMAKYYGIDNKKYDLKKDILLFLDDDFIGNEFDAYELIFTNSY